MPKQLSLSERIVIEKMLVHGYSFAAIARQLDRSASTIAREVKNYRHFVKPISYRNSIDCIHYHSCLRNRLCEDSGLHGCYGQRCKLCPEGIVCMTICPQYISSHCKRHDKPPYTCHGCPTDSQKKCMQNHAYYTAHKANSAHLRTLRLAHSGIRKTPEELQEMGELIKLFALLQIMRKTTVLNDYTPYERALKS